ncbi:hypothetical protein E4T56_gene3539 [Termitomyces sp. T112]|nr:hypothetical protein E4T56_gene3539 [Termitomyces sp. T112]
MEFTRCTRTLLTNLGYSDTSMTLEVWADQLLNFHEHYLQGNLLETMQGTLDIDNNLRNELCALTPPAPAMCNARSLLEHEAKPRLPFPPTIPEPRSQWPLPHIDDDNRTLFYIDKPGNPANKHAPCNRPPQDQPPHFNLCTSHVNAPPPHSNAPAPPQQRMGPGAPQPPFLTNHPHPLPASMPNPPTNANYFGPPTPEGPPRWAPGPALGNVGQTPGRGPPNGRPPGGWGPVMDNFPLQRGNRNNYYYYYNAGPPPQAQNPQDNTCNALAQEGKLDIQKPKPFTGHDSQKWRIFLTQCLTMFQLKPITFQLESSRVAFAASYLQGIAFDHYTALLWFDPNNSMLSNWLAFTQEFLSKFGVFDTIAEVEENLFNLRMCNNKRFMTFIVQFKWEAYKTGWNYNALQFALHRALPQWIKDVLCLAPKQTTYNGYKALVTQVDQHYWEDCSKNMNSKTTIDHFQTPPQLRSRSACGASSTFVSNQLGLQCNDLDKLLELQLFNRSPAMTRITQYHDNTLTLDNDLQFQAQLLVTQLPLPTPIMLGLPWLQDINSNINWKNLTMQFPGPKRQYLQSNPESLNLQ